MDAAVIKFKASGQQLSVVSTNLFAANTVSYIRAEFELGHNWDGWDSVRAVWATDFAKIATVLDSDGSCTIPWEVLKRTATLYVNLVGSISDGDELTDRLTTYKVKALDVNGCTNVDGDNTQPITPSQFEQFVEVVHNDAEAAADARDEARGYASDAEGYRDEAVGAAADAKDYRDAAKGYADDAEADAEEIRNMSATATTLPEGSSATASYSDGVLSLGIPKGDTGATGATGNGIASAVLNADYTLTLNFTEGTHYTTPPIRGAQGVQGETGNGIDRIELTDTTGAVKTYTIYFTDGSTYDFEVTDGEVTDAVLDEATIVQTNSDNVPYLFRNSGGDVRTGRKEFDTIVGGTVGWNQLAQNGDFTSSTGWKTVNTAKQSLSVSNNIATVTPTIEGNEVGISGTIISDAVKIPAGHKTLLKIEVKCTQPTNIKLCIAGAQGGATSQPSITANAWQTIACGWSYNSPLMNLYVFTSATLSTSDSIQFKNAQVFDLTQMFGSTIADYIYSLEQATAGAGVAWFRKLFPKPYYEYNAGELLSVNASSHDTVGFNAFDGIWESGTINSSTGAEESGNYNRSTNYIPVIPNTVYYGGNGNGTFGLRFYDANKGYITNGTVANGNATFTTPSNAHFLRLVKSTSVNNDICINLHWDGERDGEYEEYVKHSYPLDSSQTLRGIPKLDASNNLYYDGDVYESDGTVTRKYGIVDLGTLTWNRDTTTRPSDSATIHAFYASVADMKKYRYSVNPNLLVVGYEVAVPSDVDYGGGDSVKDKLVSGADPNGHFWLYDSRYNEFSTSQFTEAVSGLYAVYELAEPTEETADPYTNPQIVDPSGTEEYVGSPIPVGHETDYPMTLTDTMPTADGTYTMSVTVQSGKRVVNWT